MNLDELQSVRDRERQIDKLQQLRESFYADAGEFIQQLRTERDRAAERADSPFDSPEVNHLTDEINTAEQTVEAIYEKRVGKIVKNASLAAADLPAETDGLTAEEQELFDTLVADIETNRERVIDVLSGESSDDGPDESQEASRRGVGSGDGVSAAGAAGDDTVPTADPTGGEDGVSAADLMGGQDRQPPVEDSQPENGSEPESVAGSEPGSTGNPVRKDGGTDTRAPTEAGETGGRTMAGSTQGRTGSSGSQARTEAGETGDRAGTGGSTQQPAIQRRRVRITGDVEPFVGLDDRDYDLDPADVVTLPATNAELLVEQDVAEPTE
jgi:DNA replication factor GINS